MFAFALAQEGYESIQWNMVTHKNGHSARLVSLPDNRKAFVDPFYGIAAVDSKGQLIDPKEAKEVVLSTNKNVEDVFISLDNKSKLAFYRELGQMSMAAEGDDLILED